MSPSTPTALQDAVLAYNRQQAARAVGLSVRTIERAIASGALRAKRSSEDDEGNPTGKYVILRADLEAWLQSLPDC